MVLQNYTEEHEIHSYIYIVAGMILQNFTTELEVHRYFYIVT
jgi:hypothetical protein